MMNAHAKEAPWVWSCVNPSCDIVVFRALAWLPDKACPLCGVVASRSVR